MVLISPSLLSADFLELGAEIASLEKSGADFLHVDVMDGLFVPNLTMGPVIIKAIKKASKIPLDVHLMIENPSCYIETYAEAGADYLSIHVEAATHLDRIIDQIKSTGCKAGVALNPSTHESILTYIINKLDLILVMSVNPGFSNQSFLPYVLKKVSAIKTMLKNSGNNQCLISIDGGISNQNAKDCIKAGVDILVAGSYILGSGDYQKAINSLREI
jgi:ribulose-phosphate 3-epimerase